ncbi:hypothetical protein CRG98_011741 [Punica granatum]|uniref:DUF4219 domain-containing protein n=1 Tax=Punica granatum TaxID=22663 RepID=A0A2I0KH40_PUNGR|nr:hypothetical protein CRG98_011741 [Punica granatum]
METSASATSFSTITPLVFDGENYQAWAVKIQAFMEGADLCQIRHHKERKTRKAKAKSCLYAAVSPTVFTRITRLDLAKAIWDYLKEEYEGNEKIRERFEATIASLENTKELSDIKLAEVLSALQAQERRSIMRKKGTAEEGMVEGALQAKMQQSYGEKGKKLKEYDGVSKIVAVERSNNNSGGNHPHC